jgi:hypothetical protein
MTPGDSVTIRLARAHETAVLAHLAELDSSSAPAAPALVAEVAGEVLAAISLADGGLVANPFRRTADVVELLRARERQLRGDGRRWRLASPAAWQRLRALVPG